MDNEMFDSWNLNALDQVSDSVWDGLCVRIFTLWAMESLMCEMKGIVENLEKTV